MKKNVFSLDGKNTSITRKKSSVTVSKVAAAFAGEPELDGRAYGQLCCPIILGASGIGKTSFVLSLIPSEWALLEGRYNSNDNFDMYEAQQHLVAEYSEANDFFGPEAEALKRKLTSVGLEGREMYKRQRTSEFRHTCFIMTANSRQMSFEDAGERRYGIVDLHYLSREQVEYRKANIRRLYDDFRNSGKGARILKHALLDIQHRGVNALAWVGDKFGKKNGAYIYYFDIDAPGDKNGAFHSCDLRYMFEKLDESWRPYGERDHQAAKELASYMANFAKTGDPNAEGLPLWKPAKPGLLADVLKMSPDGTRMGHPQYLKLTKNFLSIGDPKA